MRISRIPAILLCILPLLAAGCSGPPTTDPLAGQQKKIADDADDFVRKLAAAGLTVVATGTVEQPFFSRGGRIYSADRAQIQVFMYETAAYAAADARKIAPDGSKIGNSVMSWIGAPHFFQEERLLILYVGSDERVLSALRTAFGSQIAGL